MFENVLIVSLVIALVVQGLFFVFAAGFRSDKVTDLSYGLSFVLIAWYLFWFESSQGLLQVLLTGMVTVWGFRLAGYLFYRIMKIKKDSRFDGIRENILKFGQFWLFQGLAVWVIMIPSTLALTKQGAGELSFFSYLGLLIWLIGLVIETVADMQKFVFKQDEKNKGKFIDSGLWKYSRHPNYFGEMLVWWGVWIMVLPVFNGVDVLSIVGPVFISLLLRYGSGIPPLEKRYAVKYKDNKNYQAYKKTTSLLVPWFKKSR